MDAVAETHQGRLRRRRASTTSVVLASLLVVFIVVTVVLVLLHHSGNATPRTTSTVAVVSPANRLRTATQSVNADMSTARSKLLSLKGIPTIGSVAAVMIPYVSSLQDYQRVLSGVEVPKSARGAAIKVRALVSDDVQFLGTINGLAPLQLGSYLEEFGTGFAQLKKDLDTLEHALRAPNR